MVFIDHCLHICFYTTRDVKAKEEIVVRYGEAFWRICTGKLLHQHQVFHSAIYAQYQQLLRSGHVLRSPPSYVLEDDPLVADQRPYSGGADEANSSPTTHPPCSKFSERSVESIVGHRPRGRGLQYCVKWVGCDDSHNTWLPPLKLKHCQALLSAYQAKRQRLT
jgi:hypothetical protein